MSQSRGELIGEAYGNILTKISLATPDTPPDYLKALASCLRSLVMAEEVYRESGDYFNDGEAFDADDE